MCAKKRTRKKKRTKKTKHKSGNKFAIGLIIFLLIIIALSFLWVEYESRYTKGTSKIYSTQIQSIDGLDRPRFTTPKAEQIIQHIGFTVSYCKNHKLPNWVSYELTRDETKGTHARNDRFVPDPKIKGHSVHTSDYTRSGYDRGHMAPAADMKWSLEAMTESFYLSNICPQHPELNRRSWKTLEERIRNWAIRDSAIIIICGPIIENGCARMGKNKISVPNGFFKVILSPFASPPQAIGFLFKNQHSTSPLKEYAVTIDSVESVSGLDFFHSLPDSIESVVEAHIDSSYWRL